MPGFPTDSYPPIIYEAARARFAHYGFRPR